MKKGITGVLVLAFILLFAAVVSAAPRSKGNPWTTSRRRDPEGLPCYDENIKGKRRCSGVHECGAK